MDQNQESLLLLISRTLRFATDHPYAATGLFGAAVGSVATYKLLTFSAVQQSVNTVLNHKVYECAIPIEDLQRMLKDPEYELRWEMTDTSVIVSAEKREPLKALPDIVVNEGES
jgi:hypothetical protein